MKKAVKRHVLTLALLAAAASAFAPPGQASEQAPRAPQRVITLGGSVTEIVYALDQGSRLVGNDQSSIYPEAANKLPRVGYYRSVPIEGVAALQPDLVIASEQAGPPEAMRRLAQLGINVQIVSDRPSVDSLNQRIDQIAQALGTPEAGQRLNASVNRELAQAQALPATAARTLLVMNRTGAPQGAGADTGAGLVLALSGLHNVLGDKKGYVPLSAEGLINMAPEVIVITEASLASSGGMEKFRATPGLAQTPAAANHCIVVMDDLLALGSGPRLAQAIRSLKTAPCISGQVRRASGG